MAAMYASTLAAVGFVLLSAVVLPRAVPARHLLDAVTGLPN